MAAGFFRLGALGAGAGAVVGRGAYQALRNPGTAEVVAMLERLPPALDGFTIVQLSDVHIGNTIRRPFVENMVSRANAVGGDMIVITGDLVDGRVAALREDAAPLADLRAPHGVYFVTGNHEYYSGADSWIEEIRSLGVRVLRNERVEIGEGDESFDLAGVDDYSAGYWRGHGPDLESALRGRDDRRELVLLAHQPRQVRAAAKSGVGLQLSGHTHGGQIWPWHVAAMIQQGGFLAGRYAVGPTQLYVSRGTGYWGPPLRLGAPAEITRVTLRSKQLALNS